MYSEAQKILWCEDIGIERIKKNETDIRKISGGRDT